MSIFSVGFSPHNSHSPFWQQKAASADNGRSSARSLKPEAPVHDEAPLFQLGELRDSLRLSRRCRNPKNLGGVGGGSLGERLNQPRLEGAPGSREGSGRHGAGSFAGRGKSSYQLWKLGPGDAGEAGDDLSRLCHVPANQSRILASESRTPEAGGDASQ